MSHNEEHVLDERRENLYFISGQQKYEKQSLEDGDCQRKGEVKPLKVVTTKEEICIAIVDVEKINVEGKDSHYNEMLRKFDEEIKLLENLLKESENEDESAVNNGKHSQFPNSE